MPEGQPKYRKLRIAWSVTWGLVCLSLIATCSTLKYRGTNIELMRRGGPGLTGVHIFDGRLSLSGEPRTQYRPKWAGQKNRYGFRFNLYSNGQWNVQGPLWVAGALLAAVLAMLAAYPWLAWRFSLRTLLIAMTIAALGYGCVATLARSLAPPAN
jgi:hypothetical protein